MDTSFSIRMATPEDAIELRQIYLPYVRETAVTFELEDPTLDDFTERVRTVLQNYPYLVAEQNDQIVGYAYASAFRPRAAYARTAESSIYMDINRRGQGMGHRLYSTLAELLKLQNICNMEACIAHCDPADEFVPATSRLFHERLGFRMVGVFQKCAYKFDRWYDMIWMEKILNKHEDAPKPLIPFPQVDKHDIDKVLSSQRT